MRISDWSSDVCSSDLQAATSPMAASAQRVRISSLLARRYGRRTRRRGGVSFRSAIAGGGFPDQRDHVGDALRPVGAELVAPVERRERGFDVGFGDGGGRAVLPGQQPPGSAPLV